MRLTPLVLAAGITTTLAGCGAPPPKPAAAPIHQITIEEILQIRQAGEPTWSPDGQQVAFAWGTGTERDLWTADTQSTQPGRPGDRVGY